MADVSHPTGDQQAAMGGYGTATYVRFAISYAMFGLAIILAVLSYLPGLQPLTYAVMAAALIGSGAGASGAARARHERNAELA